MIREYYRFIREYFKLAQMNKKYFIMMLITAFLYKGANLLIPLAASLIIKYITLKNYPMTYLSLVFLIIAYFFRVLFFYINHKYYGKNNHYCFIHLQQKIFDKVKFKDLFLILISKVINLEFLIISSCSVSLSIVFILPPFY